MGSRNLGQTLCTLQRYGSNIHIAYSSCFLGLQRSVQGWSHCSCREFCRLLRAAEARRELIWRAAGVAQTDEMSAGKKPARRK